MLEDDILDQVARWMRLVSSEGSVKTDLYGWRIPGHNAIVTECYREAEARDGRPNEIQSGDQTNVK